MYEHRRQPVLPRAQFRARVVRHVGFALAIVAAALGVGVMGYRFIAGMDWIDALLDASMILGGMGPVGELQTNGAKVFASAYALFAGLAFIGILGVVLAPFAHRIMHMLHVEEETEE